MSEENQDTMMKASFNALREEIKNMRQDLGTVRRDLVDRMTQVEQRPTTQPIPNVGDLTITYQTNPLPTCPTTMRNGFYINNNPNTITRNQQQ